MKTNDQIDPLQLINIRINNERMRMDFDTLAAIGATTAGGVHRPAFSDAHFEAGNWFRKRAGRIGPDIRVTTDAAGNQMVTLFSHLEGEPEILIGSHLDSVPDGGRFDGALGVVAALEVLETIRESGVKLRHPLTAVNFMDEEGAYIGLMGSRALSGTLPKGEVDHLAGRSDAFKRGLRKAGLECDAIFAAQSEPGATAGYLELHIEQGLRLKNAGAQIGVVTGIVGIRCFCITFKGRADHAGTTPMDARQDAGLGASSFSLAARDLIMREFPASVTTVGNMIYMPGASNVVPNSVAVSLEFRADSMEALDAMESALTSLAREHAARFDLSVTLEALERVSPVPTDKTIIQMIDQSAHALALASIRMPSGAGHDAQAMAAVCPVGMIFVPSEHGASHSAREHTPWEDCVNGANVLLHSVLGLTAESVLIANNPDIVD